LIAVLAFASTSVTRTVMSAVFTSARVAADADVVVSAVLAPTAPAGD
jgi:hypothetical protein